MSYKNYLIKHLLLLVYVLGLSIIIIGCDNTSRSDRFVNDHVNTMLSKANSTTSQSEQTSSVDKTAQQYQNIINIFGNSVVNWLFCYNDGLYYNVSLYQNGSAVFTTPNSSTIRLRFVKCTSNNVYLFADQGNSNNTCEFNLNSRRMTMVFNGSAYTFNILGPKESYQAPRASSPSSVTNTNDNSRRCSLCGGKGWRAGNKTPVYNMGTTYCRECDGYFPNSHSHDQCPSCQGRGYVNY